METWVPGSRDTMGFDGFRVSNGDMLRGTLGKSGQQVSHRDVERKFRFFWDRLVSQPMWKHCLGKSLAITWRKGAKELWAQGTPPYPNNSIFSGNVVPKHVINFSTMKIAVWGLGPPFRTFLCIWTSSHREYHEKSGGCWPLSSPTSAFRWYTNAYFHRCAPHRSPSWGCVAWHMQYDHPPRSGPRYLDLSDLAMGWKFRGYPDGWLVDFMENPLKIGWWLGVPPWLRKPPCKKDVHFALPYLINGEYPGILRINMVSKRPAFGCMMVYGIPIKKPCVTEEIF